MTKVGSINDFVIDANVLHKEGLRLVGKGRIIWSFFAFKCSIWVLLIIQSGQLPSWRFFLANVSMNSHSWLQFPEKKWRHLFQHESSVTTNDYKPWPGALSTWTGTDGRLLNTCPSSFEYHKWAFVRPTGGAHRRDRHWTVKDCDALMVLMYGVSLFQSFMWNHAWFHAWLRAEDRWESLGSLWALKKSRLCERDCSRSEILSRVGFEDQWGKLNVRNSSKRSCWALFLSTQAM